MRKLILFTTLIALTLSTILVSSALAENDLSGKIVKLEDGDTLYYISVDGERYVFPNEKTYKTWFTDFSDVVTVTVEELADYSLVGNIRYRPGVILVKIQTDPKVYAVTGGGVLRWIRTEKLAKKFYGEFWNQLIEDIPAGFFVNYTTGKDIDEEEDLDPDQEVSDNQTIDDNQNRGKGKKLDLSKRGLKANTSRREKVEVCHIPPGNPDAAKTIVIGKPALVAHLAHGDTEGKCEGDGGEQELEISNIQKEKTDTTATITWETNLASSSKIEYATESLDTANSTEMVSDDTLVTSHSLGLTNLTPSTTYYFIVSSTDADNNTATSSEKTFDTKEPEDETAPVISNSNVTTSTSTATFTWDTDELANSLVMWDINNVTSTSSATSSDSLVSSHSLMADSLTPSTTYNYILKSTDEADNTASTTQDTFTTDSE